MSTFFDVNVWEQEWQAKGEAAARRRQQAGVDMSKMFDHKAERFDQQSFDVEGRKRSARILNWLTTQGVTWEGETVLDVGAASGVFTVPMLERGAVVTALESSGPLVSLLRHNVSRFPERQVEIISGRYERLVGQQFDLVFVSMCPVINDWSSVQELLDSARKYCYISMSVSGMAHSLLEEVWPTLSEQRLPDRAGEMGYLLHLLYLKGYAYQSLVTREEKTQTLTIEEASKELATMLPSMLALRGMTYDEARRQQVSAYLQKHYPTGKVEVRQGGRFGKVLVRLQDQSMYSNSVND